MRDPDQMRIARGTSFCQMGPAFLSPAAPPPGMTQQLWRGVVRMGSAAPPGWPANFPDRFGQAERLVDLAPVPAVAGPTLAGFLTAGTEAPLLLADPPGLLVLDGAPDQPMGLIRLDAEGRAAWRAGLPIARLRSVLPGARQLVLAGNAVDGAEVVLAVALADGAVAPFSLSA